MTHNTPLIKVFEGYETVVPFAFKEQFLATPEREYDIVLEGKMHEIWHRPKWLKPLFILLGWLGILVPVTGKDVPARLGVVPGVSPDGEPFHEWNRTFDLPKPVHFNTTVVYDPKLKNIADLVGPGKSLHMVWDGVFSPPDKFTLDTISNAVRFGRRVFYLPKWLWALLFGRVKFVQRAHSLEGDKVDVDLRIIHPMFGEVFGYRGTFQTVRYPKNG